MHLRPMSERATPTVPTDSIDARGWEVRTGEDGRRAGRVHEMLVDDDGYPRYLDVELASEAKHVLVPVGQARADASHEVVWLPGLRHEQFAAVPAYAHRPDALTAEYRHRLQRAYSAVYRARSRRPGRAPGRPRPSTGARAPSGPVARPTAPPRRLAALSELEGFRVAAGEPDPRGWSVVAGDGRRVGAVRDLVVDTGALKIRYVDCALNGRAADEEEADRRILIPLGFTRLDEERRAVIVDTLSAAELRALPAYRELPVDPEFEDRLHAEFLGGFRREE